MDNTLNKPQDRYSVAETPVRVLHVLGSLGRGGAETWLVQLLKRLDRRRVQTDVLIHRRGGAYEGCARSLGADILFCGHPQRPLPYMSNLGRLLQEQGPYHVVHSHLQFFNGLVLRVAYKLEIPGRIAHARNSTDGRGTTPYRIIYRRLMRFWIKRYATHLFAVSARAAEETFWQGVIQNGQCRTLTGIDFSAFQTKVNREQLRAELGLPIDSPVIGHVGSFTPQKNHQFLVEIALQLLELRPDAIFLFVGDGALRPGIEEMVCSAGKQSNFRFLGERNDVPRLLRAMDAFIFPSLFEGLPRALLEAQAAGLPCVVSNTITPEAAARPGNILFLPLGKAPQIWARALAETANAKPACTAKGEEAVHQFKARGLTIQANARELTDLYEKIARTTPEYDH